MAVLACGLWPAASSAQVLGTFHWQTQPFCNVITVTVTQQGGEFLLDGTDDQCGAGQKAAVRGLGFFNPDGSVGFGLNIVTAPGGVPVHVDAALGIATLSGPWRDSAGRTGQFVFGANASGLSPRPGGKLGSGSIDTTQVQRRITGTCPAGQVIAAVAENGSVTCQAVSGASGGDITSVSAGPGLSGGGTTGDVTLGVAFGGGGSLPLAARSDHRHQVNGASVAIGTGALAVPTSGDTNTAVGHLAMAATTTGSQNVAVGWSALQSQTSGFSNTAVGMSAMGNTTAAFGNVAIGFNTLLQTASNYGVAVGFNALRDNTVGTANTAVGTLALNLNTSGSDNTATGYRALLVNTTGERNTAVGSAAMQAEATGIANTAVGNRALANHLSGNGNVAVGDSALSSMSSGNDTVAIGYGALALNLNGVGNTAVGTSALNANLNGNRNTALGLNALLGNQTGGDNVAIGEGASAASANGSRNVAVGRAALANNNSATDNVAVGTGALPDFTNGIGNIAIGSNAGVSLISGSSNIYLNGLPSSSTESGTMRIGSLTRAFISGIRGVTTAANDAVPVVVDSFGQLGTVSSSRRFKDHINDLGAVSRGIFALRPVSFTYKQAFADGSTPVQYGLIAEEVNEVMPELVARTKDGEIETVKYHVLPTLLLAEVQRLERERAAEHLEVISQRQELAALRTMVEQLQRQLTVSPR